MTDPTRDSARMTASTRVTFPSGKTSGASTVVLAAPYRDEYTLIITEETPFYPVSHSWPDQQSDQGSITVNGHSLQVLEALTAAVRVDDDENRLYIGAEIPTRKTEPGWRFFVAHIVAVPETSMVDNLLGAEAQLSVNEERRMDLSATHTSTHLAGLALNKHAVDFWRREVVLDGLGHPDLDRLAMDESTIMPAGAVDRYRFGKSLRKKGFESSQFLEQADSLVQLVNAQVNEWIATGAQVEIKADGPSLESPRAWVTELDGTHIEFPCGGTHIRSLSELASVAVSFDVLVDEPGVTMRTVPTRVT